MIQSYFQQHPYKASTSSELEKDSRLALHLLLFLLSSQDTNDGTWQGTHMGAKMRNTCHALEALNLLGPELSAGAVEAGVAWLINLPDIFNIASEEEAGIRLYPSRFKTLAWLGYFDDIQVTSDFEELEEHLDEDGLLQGIIPKQLLGSMVYVDCLSYLERLAPLPLLSQERRELALNYIQQQVQLWYESLQDSERHSAITTAGDLSYAIDLLFRARRLSKKDEINQEILKVLISALEQPENLRATPSDTLYCGIQLATHYSEIPEAREAIRHLIDHLRTKYERLDLKREAVFFHPLVLRVMLAYYGDHLKAEIVKLLLKQERENLELRQQDAEQRLKDDFQALIKRRFEVEITDVQPLTGGITSAEVFRVHFSLKLSSISERQEVRIEAYHPSPGSLVIKRSSLDSLRQSIEKYHQLPAAIRPYFAQHDGVPQILEATPSAPSYLIMEDLTYTQTFHDILARQDQGTLSKTQKDDLEKACDAICRGLFAIYNHTRRSDTEFFGPQLSRLYISNLEQSLIRMCRPDKFPHLKTWLRGFWLGERKYSSIEHYLRKLESYKARLKVPYLMLIHGDCHSRNIMLDASLEQIRLIDLDHLEYDGDYIQDIALLLEDVAVFRFLFDEDYRFHLGKAHVRFISESSKQQRVIENRIEYRPFSTEAVRLFQQAVLRRLESYAQSIDDSFFKERLWLALAQSLMGLVAKQTEKEYASVLYVEAVKLLDDLVVSLNKHSGLPDIPFPGIHPTGVKRGSLDLPNWYHEDSALAHIHDNLMSLDPTIRFLPVASGRIAQYFVPNGPHPFAVIDTKEQSPSVLLACSREDLDDPAELARERKTGSALRVIVRITEQTDISAVHKLVRQAFKFNQTTPYLVEAQVNSPSSESLQA